MTERDTADRGTGTVDDATATTSSGDGSADGAGRQLSTADIARGGTSDVAPGAGTEPTDGAAEPASGRTVAAGATTDDQRTPLFPADQASEFRSRWDTVQVGFVDEPRRAVEDADSLVAEVMQSLASAFSAQRASLEGQWSKGEDVSTEDLRQTLRRYRSFFDRLLSL